jgi:1-deoxy-D-xylulose-5-phosphate reductoisomerase
MTVGVSILGSTGTIGVNTLDVIERNRDKFKVVALTANLGVSKMTEQVLRFQPELAVMADPDAAQELERALRNADVPTRVASGASALAQAASLDGVDQVMAGIVGAAGLEPTLAAARAGKRVLLANKEALIMSGELFMQAVRDGGAELLPVDSEHNAIYQCMPQSSAGAQHGGVRRILLTGSGGPFRQRDPQSLWSVTPEEACAHPNWVMGRKISVDSATMMNKGLEFIEACWLFDVEPQAIEVVLHPQSIVHSMVEYEDGSVLAQMGNPDMRTPIAHAMAWPERAGSGVASLDFFALGDLQFGAPDFERFPCLRYGIEAAKAGGEASAVLNAANEEAVGAFLAGNLAFPNISNVVGAALESATSDAPTSLEGVLKADAKGRDAARSAISRLGHTDAKVVA